MQMHCTSGLWKKTPIERIHFFKNIYIIYLYVSVSFIFQHIFVFFFPIVNYVNFLGRANETE